MKLYDLSWVIVLAVILAGIVGIATQAFMNPDNFIEEDLEDFIQMETGDRIDLSPGSPE